MNPFAVTEEQEELRSTIRAVLARHADSESVRRAMASEGQVDEALWGRLANDLGVTGLMVPEDLGGAGYTFSEVAVVLEELGRSVAAVPFFSSAVLATSVLLETGTEQAQRDWLPRIASGEVRATVALVDEESVSWDLSDVRLPADEAGSGHRLTGGKRFVVDGATADVILVVARHAGGLSVFLVEKGAEGVVATPATVLDQTRALADLSLDDAPALLVSAPGTAAEGLERSLDVASTALAIEAVGGAQRCLELSVDYARTRYQFGRPIGSYQAISHKCADMLADVEQSRSVAQYAVWTVVEGDPTERGIAVSTAAAFCADAYLRVAGETIQVHGGIGFTWEHDAHLFFKRAKANQLLFGDATDHRRRLGELIKL